MAELLVRVMPPKGDLQAWTVIQLLDMLVPSPQCTWALRTDYGEWVRLDALLERLRERLARADRG